MKPPLLMLDTIDRLKSKGKLIIFNTHYPEHALRYSNKVLMLNKSFGYRFGNTTNIITKENIYGDEDEESRYNDAIF